MAWQRPHQDRGKALLLVAGLHLALGLALVVGLAGKPLRHAADRLAIFDIEPPPPQPPLPPPLREASDDLPAARDDAGKPNLADKPAPIALPPPTVKLPEAPPLATSNDTAPLTGSAPSAGAAAVDGSGRGAGGSGEGTGGGGSGGTGGGGTGIGSEARLISGNLSQRDYRRIRAFGSPRGQAVLAIEVDRSGRLSRCLPMVGSGNAALDAELCQLMARTRWEPARDRSGEPIPVALRYVATWDRN